MLFVQRATPNHVSHENRPLAMNICKCAYLRGPAAVEWRLHRHSHELVVADGDRTLHYFYII
jgi:hypothetical protein